MQPITSSRSWAFLALALFLALQYLPECCKCDFSSDPFQSMPSYWVDGTNGSGSGWTRSTGLKGLWSVESPYPRVIAASTHRNNWWWNFNKPQLVQLLLDHPDVRDHPAVVMLACGGEVPTEWVIHENLVRLKAW